MHPTYFYCTAPVLRVRVFYRPFMRFFFLIFHNAGKSAAERVFESRYIPTMTNKNGYFTWKKKCNC